ncbi:MAG: hypothetical protein ABW215_03055, partial [Kibdelosporangium sp.]
IESVPPSDAGNKVEGRSEVNLSDKSGARRLNITSADPRLINQPVGEPVVTPSSGSVVVNLGGVGVRLSGQGISIDEVQRIARSITQAADVADLATWFDADQAIPLS